MTTVLSNLKNIGKKLTSLTSIRSNLFSEKSIEKLISNKNLKEIELSMNSKDLLELKKRIIIYRIKKLRNDSALLIQKMWGKYLKKLNIHKLAHHLTGCYTVSISSKGRTKAFIKIFCDETNKDCYKIQRLRYCPIRNCFAIDIPKNKFYTPKKIMHFIFLNRNKEKFFDENYKKVYFVNEYVHQIDFSCYDKNQKICEEAAKKEKERQKQNDINNEYHFPGGHVEENETLTDTLKREIKEEIGVIIDTKSYKNFAKKTGYYKDWPEKGKNRKIEIYYFIINKDIVPNLRNTNYTESEKQGQFTIKKIKLNEIKKVLKDNIDKYGDKRGIGVEMLELFEICKDKIFINK